jgi:TRAP-type C4-dicarboxylate transport system permease large subunit
MLPYIVALFVGIAILCAFPVITTIVPDTLLRR